MTTHQNPHPTTTRPTDTTHPTTTRPTDTTRSTDTRSAETTHYPDSRPATSDASASSGGGLFRGRVSGGLRLVVVGAAAASALAGWVVLEPVAGVDLRVQQGTVVHIGAVSVFVAAVVAAFAGWGLLAILERRTRNARDIWTVVATIVCLTSTSSPIDRGIGLDSKLGLAGLHLLVGATVIIGLRRTAAARERC
ncbi:DUF6069 family protein [Kribbella sp. NPDC026611]|uniref:DUF6069 family protein n=1 Tax=Kribbella sp. NPDC026611 TaxID=3154911 RepID=UPI0033EDECBA